MIRLRQSGVDEILIKRVRDWYDPGPGVFIQSLATASFSPAMLFTGSTTGVWYDPSDFTTLYQDAAGTTPVTAVEQPVGLMLDKSGRGNHAFNPTAVGTANFPVLQQDGTGRYYLAFNGTNQWLQTNSIDFAATDKMFVCAGVRKKSDSTSSAKMFIELSNGATNRRVSIGQNTTTDRIFFGSGGDSLAAATSGSLFPAPITVVVAGIGDISGRVARLEVNSGFSIENNASQGSGMYPNAPIYIGSRAGNTFFADANFYGIVIAGKQASASEITNTETFINQKTGAY